MAYQTVATKTAGESFTSTNHNVMAANFTYLHSGRPSDSDGGVTIAVTRNATSYGEMDSTNLKKSVTINNGRALVVFHAYVSCSNSVGNTGTITIYQDGVDIGDGTYGIWTGGQATARSVYWAKIITGLSVDSHEWKIMGKVSNAALTIQIGENAPGPSAAWNPTVFDVMEWPG